MKVLHIIKREYVENIRKKGFIIGTILAPVILLAFYSIPILSVFFVPGEQISIAILDHTGAIAGTFAPMLDDTLKDGRTKYLVDVYDRDIDDFASQRQGLISSIENGDLDVLLEFPADILDAGSANYISKDMFNERIMDDLRDRLNPVVVNRRLAGQGLDFEAVSKMTRRVSFNENKITKSGVLEESQLKGEFILVIVFVMILYMTLLTWGMSVQRAIIEEKSSRVIELMLSSVEPKDLFFGKILGIGSLGLTQVAIWSVMFLAIGFSSAIATAQFLDYVQVSLADVTYFLIFFVLGFMLYASLFTIIGAICNTEQDAQQLQTIVIMPLVIPLMLMFLVMQNPNATISVILSYIPFFTPMLMLTRVLIAEPSTWEILLSVAILLVSIYGVTLFSARVFRVGILMYGKRPNLKEIIRWSRYA